MIEGRDMNSHFLTPVKHDLPSNFICLCGVGSATSSSGGVTEESIEAYFKIHGEIERIAVEANRTFISFKNEEDAVRVRKSLNRQVLEGISSHPVTIQFAIPATVRKMPEPSCTSLTKDVQVPGLGLIHEFITLEEEQQLLAYFNGQPWDTNAVHRRTQHYGRKIDFRTRGLLDSNMDTSLTPIPDVCLPILERACSSSSSSKLPQGHLVVADADNDDTPDQLTINEYNPGLGIASHVDVHSLFHDLFYIITLESGCVMDFRKMEEEVKSPPIDDGGGEERQQQQPHKALWLPPRSLLVMQGEARYGWTHGISSRKTDKVEGKLIPRGRRVSLSFRRINQKGTCHCNYPHQCDSRGVEVGSANLVDIPLERRRQLLAADAATAAVDGDQSIHP